MNKSSQPVPLVPVTSRPEGMSYEAYKALQREQEQLLKAYKRGRVVHVSSRLEKLQTADGRELIARRNHTYKKPPTP